MKSLTRSIWMASVHVISFWAISATRCSCYKLCLGCKRKYSNTQNRDGTERSLYWNSRKLFIRLQIEVLPASRISMLPHFAQGIRQDRFCQGKQYWLARMAYIDTVRSLHTGADTTRLALILNRQLLASVSRCLWRRALLTSSDCRLITDYHVLASFLWPWSRLVTLSKAGLNC